MDDGLPIHPIHIDTIIPPPELNAPFPLAPKYVIMSAYETEATAMEAPLAPIILRRRIEPSEKRTYFGLTFSVPEKIERIDLSYHYDRYRESTVGAGADASAERLCRDACGGTADRPASAHIRRQINLIDLALSGPNGRFIGASGSDRDHIFVSGTQSAAGYASGPIEPGEWTIHVGAIEIAPEGCEVTYTVRLTPKRRRLWRGDMHVHTSASDGFLPTAETAALAKAAGLDFLAITDHNNYAQNDFPAVPGITLLPGSEWTHLYGHANLLGVKKPLERAYCVDSPEDALELLGEARARGAFLSINHPFWDWKLGYDLPFDGIEVWNGPMVENNQKCVEWWHELLCARAIAAGPADDWRLPALGGSDFHRPELERVLGSPCTGLYADSAEPDDLLDAVRGGRSYIAFAPNGPGVDIAAAQPAQADGPGSTADAIDSDGLAGSDGLADPDGSAGLDSAAHAPVSAMRRDGGVCCRALCGIGDFAPMGAETHFAFTGLRGGDRIRLITNCGEETILCPPGADRLDLIRRFDNARFCRTEVLRVYGSRPDERLAMVSNPIYYR